MTTLAKQKAPLEIDPDPELERKAEETAQRVMEGGRLDIQRMEHTDVHVQRAPKQTGFDESGDFAVENVTEDELPESMQEKDLKLADILKKSLGVGSAPALTILANKPPTPETLVLATKALIATGSVTALRELKQQLGTEDLRKTFAAAGQEELFDKVMDRLRDDSETRSGDSQGVGEGGNV